MSEPVRPNLAELRRLVDGCSPERLFYLRVHEIEALLDQAEAAERLTRGIEAIAGEIKRENRMLSYWEPWAVGDIADRLRALLAGEASE